MILVVGLFYDKFTGIVFPNSGNFLWRRGRPGRIFPAAAVWGKKFMLTVISKLSVMRSKRFYALSLVYVFQNQGAWFTPTRVYGVDRQEGAYIAWVTSTLDDGEVVYPAGRLNCLVHFYWRRFLVDFAWVEPLSYISCGAVGPILVLLAQVAYLGTLEWNLIVLFIGCYSHSTDFWTC